MIHIPGVEQGVWTEQISSRLAAYSETSGLTFDIDGAPDLTYVPNTNYIGGSTTVFEHLGQAAGELHVIALGPEDGTGAGDASRKLEYNRQEAGTRLYPISRAGVLQDVHVTLVSFGGNGQPVPFAGSLDLLILPHEYAKTIEKSGVAGQPRSTFKDKIMTAQETARPTATQVGGDIPLPGETVTPVVPHRPYALYNSTKFTQFCAVLALNRSAPAELHDALAGPHYDIPRLR